MIHKKITVVGITIAAAFSFGVLKPMKQQLKTVDVNDFTNLILFKDVDHLDEICKFQKNIIADNGKSTWYGTLIPANLCDRNIRQYINDEYETTLKEKQNPLEKSLEKINYQFVSSTEPQEYDTIFKSIALLKVLKEQAHESENFAPRKNCDLRTKYDGILEPADKWLEIIFPDKMHTILEPYMLSAAEKIESLMNN